jgi:hypothetical protein
MGRTHLHFDKLLEAVNDENMFGPLVALFEKGHITGVQPSLLESLTICNFVIQVPQN